MHFSPEPQLRNTLCRRHGAFGKLLFWTDQKETFASRENTLLGQWEVGVGGGSRGGPMARLSRLVGRGRALEILLRKTPDLSGELFRRMNAVYAQVLPGLGARVVSVIVQRERRTFHAGGSCGNVFFARAASGKTFWWVRTCRPGQRTLCLRVPPPASPAAAMCTRT